MHFKHYDSLRIFTYVARHGSFSAAAATLNLTKGAVSHQIRQLESSLGFALFHRQPRGVTLSPKGEKLLSSCIDNFNNIDQVITNLQDSETADLTLGTTTYFSSRWLSQRLMSFMQLYPKVRLRLQPMIDLSNLDGEGIDIAIRWGNGEWKDTETKLLFSCPAWPTGNLAALKQVQELGLEKAFDNFTLLHDGEHSDVWRQWYSQAGLTYPDKEDTLIIRDPNVRVEAVINSQGVALNDELIEREQNTDLLYRLSDIELKNYGYFLVYSKNASVKPAVDHFTQWVLNAAKVR